MASTPQAFWQTLLAARSALSEVLVGTTALLDAIYKDVQPIQTGLGQTINVPVPSAVNSQVTNSTTADPVFNDYNVTDVPISLTLHPQYGVKIRTFDQYTSPEQIREVLIDPGVKAIAEQANAFVAALINSTSLASSANNPVISTTASAISPAQFLTGFQQLLTQKVNVWDVTAMNFVQAVPVYANQLQTAAWTQESIAGINIAQQARINAAVKVAYASQQLTDQAMPRSGSSGSYVYNSVYMSKYAIAAVLRPLPPGDPMVSRTTYIDWKGVSIRITLSWSGVSDAYLLNIDCGMGISVVRPEQAQLFSTAQ
jgi:hypothetical protein